MVVGAGSKPEGVTARATQGSGEGFAVLIVQIHDGEALLMEVFGEQTLLGLEIALETHGEVEMVAREVREDGCMKREPAHPLLDEGMRGDLESRVSRLLVHHLFQQL